MIMRGWVDKAWCAGVFKGWHGRETAAFLRRLSTRQLPDGTERVLVEKTCSLSVEKAADGTWTVVASDDTEDRYGDVVVPDGWTLANYAKNPVWLVDHSYRVESIVGVGRDVKVTGGRLVASYVPDPVDSGECTSACLAKLDAGSLRTVSVGFMPIRWERISDDKGNWTGGFRFLEHDLLEISWVAVPANPNATLLSVPAASGLSLPSPGDPGHEHEPPESTSAREMAELQDSVVSLWVTTQRGRRAAVR